MTRQRDDAIALNERLLELADLKARAAETDAETELLRQEVAATVDYLEQIKQRLSK